jgi:hypothetical protein
MNPANRPVGRRSVLFAALTCLVSLGLVQQSPALAQTPSAPGGGGVGDPAGHPPYHAIVGVL